jgi:RNA polymerase sigma-70 factor (ECF subfamily)
MSERASKRLAVSVFDGGDDVLSPPARDPEAERGALLSLARAAVSDADAMAELLLAVAPAVVRAVRVVLGPRAVDLEDVKQQALLNVMRAVPGFRGECHPAGFASRIALHTALSARRRARGERLVFSDAVDIHEMAPPGPRRTDAEIALYRRHFVRDLLLRLPQEQAEVLALHVILGHSLPEIGAATATPLATVKSRLRLAKEYLRKVLDDGDEVPARGQS